MKIYAHYTCTREIEVDEKNYQQICNAFDENRSKDAFEILEPYAEISSFIVDDLYCIENDKCERVLWEG